MTALFDGVTGNYGDRVTAAQTVDLTNPPEWELVSKANQPLATPRPTSTKPPP